MNTHKTSKTRLIDWSYAMYANDARVRINPWNISLTHSKTRFFDVTKSCKLVLLDHIVAVRTARFRSNQSAGLVTSELTGLCSRPLVPSGGSRICKRGAKVERRRREDRGAEEGAKVERRRRRGGRVWGGGIPLPNERGVWGGGTRNFFDFESENGDF